MSKYEKLDDEGRQTVGLCPVGHVIPGTPLDKTRYAGLPSPDDPYFQMAVPDCGYGHLSDPPTDTERVFDRLSTKETDWDR